MTSKTWPEASLFDLDGTLIDSAADLAAAINELLEGDSLAPLSVEQVTGMIGNGIRQLVIRAYAAYEEPLAGPALNLRHDSMMEIYGRHLTGRTTLMPGARDAILAQSRAGRKLAVITNKPEAYSRTILAHFDLLDCIYLVVGGDTGPQRKPAPDMLLHALDRMDVLPRAAVMVGDGPADIEAARSAGVPSVAVHGGYTAVPAAALGATAHIGSLSQLDEALDAIRGAVTKA